MLNTSFEKFAKPPSADIIGVKKLLTKVVTSPLNAAPTTTPTARSTTLPLKINFLNPSIIPPQSNNITILYDIYLQ